MMSNHKGNETVLTLDAGGTNFVFSAVCHHEEIGKPVTLKAVTTDTEGCLATLVQGLTTVRQQLSEEPVAISFAFPGPADYAHGVIGDLPHFPSFRGGVPLGPYLESVFGIPVFIQNDGNLFAYGEALAGALPRVNKALEEKGSQRRYKNLIGVTLGTGFGCGVVIDKVLLTGDNGCGGDTWCNDKDIMVDVPHTDKKVLYCNHRKVAVMVSELGASKAISLGAYHYAMNQISK